MKRFLLASMFGKVLLLVGCLGVSIFLRAQFKASSIPKGRAILSAPQIIEFSVLPSEVALGEPVSLRWHVIGATRIMIDPGVGAVPIRGKKTVMPAANTTYTIIAINSAGRSSRSASIRVRPASMSVNTMPPPQNRRHVSVKKPGLGEVTRRVLPKEASRTYSETWFDFVEQAPSAKWKQYPTGYAGNEYWSAFDFHPDQGLIAKYWNNAILEDGRAYGKSLFIQIQRAPVDTSWTSFMPSRVRAEYEISIPANAWFTAKIGFMAGFDSPEYQPLIYVQANYSRMDDNHTYSIFQLDLSIDHYVDRIDIDLSNVKGHNLTGTNGIMQFYFHNEHDCSLSLPWIITEAKIAR